MTSSLDVPYIEFNYRLLLGVEPRDAARGTRVSARLTIAVEKLASLPISIAELERYFRGLQSAGSTLSDTMAALVRHDTSRYVLGFRSDLVDGIDLRIFDPWYRFAPRRVSVPIVHLTHPDDPTQLDPVPLAQRTRRIGLFPGRTYPLPEATTGLRGRVIRGDPANPGSFIPVRWPRAEALVGAKLVDGALVGGTLVGVAHGDANGDFLLVIDSNAAPALSLPDPLTAYVTAYGPATIPVPSTPLLPLVDEYWDVPQQSLAAPGVTPDAVADGIVKPASYTAASPPVLVTFTYGALREGLSAFAIP